MNAILLISNALHPLYRVAERQAQVQSLMEIESARSEAEIALLGLSASNSLQKPLTHLLNLLEEDRNLFQSIIKEFDQIVRIWEAHTNSGKEENEETITVLEALNNSMASHLVEAAKIKTRSEESYRRIHLRADVLKRISPDVTPEIDNLFSTINSEIQKRNETREEFTTRRARFRSTLNESPE